MRTVSRFAALGVAATMAAALNSNRAVAIDPLDPSSPCSVFDAAPCTPSYCGVFGPWPCVPALGPAGQGLRLTVHSRDAGGRAPEGSVNSLRELFAALRACWAPPPMAEALHGMEMSVRLSFKRNGEPVAAPRVTYSSSAASAETRSSYRRAIDAAFERCTPVPFSPKMGAAIAGRPIAIRFVDDRDQNKD